MRINDKTAKEINMEYKNSKWHDDFDLKINFGGDGICDYANGSSGWQICKIEDISRLMRSLEKMSKAIEQVTGFEC